MLMAFILVDDDDVYSHKKKKKKMSILHWMLVGAINQWV